MQRACCSGKHGVADAFAQAAASLTAQATMVPGGAGGYGSVAAMSQMPGSSVSAGVERLALRCGPRTPESVVETHSALQYCAIRCSWLASSRAAHSPLCSHRATHAAAPRAPTIIPGQFVAVFKDDVRNTSVLLDKWVACVTGVARHKLSVTLLCWQKAVRHRLCCSVRAAGAQQLNCPPHHTSLLQAVQTPKV